MLSLFQKKEEELPPWIRSERERKLQSEEGSDLPFPVYLIGSALVAIAAVRISIATATCHYCGCTSHDNSSLLRASSFSAAALREHVAGLAAHA